ncbi:divergent polysaccharide deacetylase family protein [Virgibacillus halophilus]|uniref:Divergent polysaccharide deacetylase family protein n=1 Tax=Tigheibacillus halophilus TaxID=361280 RepID=A0ABU5C6T9_9BACI|nr:divergent polysaccharide deacetylase family protein [Virgibacillus halophilus]
MKNLTAFMLLTLLVIQPSITFAAPVDKNLAIVIDDFGNNMKGTKEILDLPFHLTIAVMPFMPTTKEDANQAYKKGHDVIIHLPMEPKSGKKSWLGPGAITSDLSNEEIRKRTENAVKNVPHAIGMNNHMGSKVMEDKRIMRIILEVCKEHGLFYLDSKTTGNSVVPELAKEIGVPVLENNVFFDDVYSVQHITKQADLVERNLSNTDQLIAIGHVGVSGLMTYSILTKYIPKYERVANIVSLSELVRQYRLLDKRL